MNKKRTTILFILATITVLISAGAMFFFYKVIKNKNEHSKAVLATLASQRSKKENQKALSEKIIEVNETKDVINGYFVDPKEIDSFINFLEKIGTNTNTEVKVESFDISPTSKNLLTVHMSGRGTFSNVMQTLMLIENAPHKIHVTNLFFNQQGGVTALDPKDPKKQNNGPIWQLEVTFNVLISS